MYQVSKQAKKQEKLLGSTLCQVVPVLVRGMRVGTNLGQVCTIRFTLVYVLVTFLVLMIIPLWACFVPVHGQIDKHLVWASSILIHSMSLHTMGTKKGGGEEYWMDQGWCDNRCAVDDVRRRITQEATMCVRWQRGLVVLGFLCSD